MPQTRTGKQRLTTRGDLMKRERVKSKQTFDCFMIRAQTRLSNKPILTGRPALEYNMTRAGNEKKNKMDTFSQLVLALKYCPLSQKQVFRLHSAVYQQIRECAFIKCRAQNRGLETMYLHEIRSITAVLKVAAMWRKW